MTPPPKTVIAARTVARVPETGAWVTCRRGGEDVLLLYVSAPDMEAHLRRALHGAGLPPHLWSEFYTLIELPWEDACRVSARILDGLRTSSTSPDSHTKGDTP